MALTRKMLEALSVPENAIQTIIDEHVATTTKINDELKEANAKLETVQKELDDAKVNDWEQKYNNVSKQYEEEHAAHEALKADIAAKENKAKKTAAITAYYEGKKVRGTNLKIALRGTDFNAIEIDEKGKIKDTKALDELLAGDFAGLVESENRVIDTGAHVGDNNGGGAVDYNLRNALREAIKRD